jgi:predicted alpha/beta-fold hydrolase
MSKAFIEQQYDVSVLNFRGCCGTNVADLYRDGILIKNGENSLMYHLGFVDDLIYYLSLLALRHDKKPIYLSGFSLGSNVILKALGQLGSDAIDKYNVAGAAVAGAPFDTERNYMQFHRDPISRLVYVENLLNKLKMRAEEILQVQYDGNVGAAGFDYRGSMDATTIYELETACVAPLFGFEDHIDYYRKTSCGYYLDRICVPTFVVNARDDPFFDSSFVPWDKVYGGESGSDGVNGGDAPVKIVFTDHGGHLGYIFHREQSEDEAKASWISEELARFVNHVHCKLFAEENMVDVRSSLPLL